LIIELGHQGFKGYNLDGRFFGSSFKTIVVCSFVLKHSSLSFHFYDVISLEMRSLVSNILIITEKPSAAAKIAVALDEKGEPEEVKKRSASYYSCNRNGDTLLVVYALGHLYELRQTVPGWKYPRLDTEWVPKHDLQKKRKKKRKRKGPDTRPILNLIKRLSKEADRFIVATDLDIEGSLIGYLVLTLACKADPTQALRMRFSTLTKSDLEDAYDNVDSSLDFPMIEAGQVRHEVDWLYGINLTRALTLAIKNTSGWFKIVSTGRVQGPTLAFAAERDHDISRFVPLPYWVIDTLGEHEGREIELEYSVKRLKTKREGDTVVQETAGNDAQVSSVSSRSVKQTPPVPFNLSGLQTECYRHFGFKPSRTLALAQKLYLDALISYPRTSSQKIPKSIDVREILKGLEKSKSYASLAKTVLGTSLTPQQGKKSDPAHPAVHPTGNLPDRRLTPSEKKVFDIIVKRFFAIFGDAALKESLRADLNCEKHLFHVRGLRVLKSGWMTLYAPYAVTKEKDLPPLKEGDTVHLKSVISTEYHTSPPPRYNPSSLLKKLEKEGLGTKATRSGIVESLKSRGYVLNERFELSTLGHATYETLRQFIPELLSKEFSQALDKAMNGILERKDNRENVLESAKSSLEQLLENFLHQESSIGETLVEGLQRYWKAREELGKCPSCGDGTLLIIHSPKTGKRFVGCSNYREDKCDLTFPLPQKGEITPLEKECPHCSHRMIKVVSGRRAWETCINWAQCPGRVDDLKALDDRRKQSAEKKSKEDDD
jgi:DNA topoisomerase-1